MDFSAHFLARVSALLPVRADEKGLLIDKGTASARIRESRHQKQFSEAFEKYTRARSKHFDASTMTLTINGTVEQAIIPLTTFPFFPLDRTFTYTDRHGNSVLIGKMSQQFVIGHLDSDAYAEFLGRYNFQEMDFLTVDDFLYRGFSATYKSKGHKVPADLDIVAKRRIGSALFKLAVEQNWMFSTSRPIRRGRPTKTHDETFAGVLPSATYDENAVRYYLVAKSSPFPSQAFVAFYNVLEYYFLSTAEDKLHHRLKVLLNNPSFTIEPKRLDALISAVRSEDAQREELNMLRNVLDRFMTDEELAEFISNHEAESGQRTFTKRRSIFGENLEISLASGHCRSNTAKVIKHIRNAIVHSSDRYKREETHVPLSDSELVVDAYVPLVQFLAEKVIFGTATP